MMTLIEKVAKIKEDYPAGTRIQLDHMDDPFAPVSAGMTGTVHRVDDMGTIHMHWDNGRSLGICPEVDSFHKI